MLLPMMANAFAGVAVVDGIKYFIVTNYQTAEVRANSYTGDIVIPETIEYDGVTCHVTSIGNGAFSGCSSLTTVSIPSSVTSIGDWAFGGCSSLTSITIPENVTSINYCIFYGCSGLTSVSIPSSVTSIEEWAFYDCSSLTSVVIPESVTSIFNNAFENCLNLTTINLPEGLDSISSSTFSNCKSLTSITIPSSVTRINHAAFDGCSSLTSVKVNIETPLPIDCNPFPNRANVTLYVPAGSKALYEAAEYWSQFSNIVEMPKCATPTITYVNGKVRFACETEDVEYVPTMTCELKHPLNGNEMEIGGTFTISVYATKDGYSNSDVATITITMGKMGDLDGDGQLSVTDVTSLVNAILGK